MRTSKPRYTGLRGRDDLVGSEPIIPDFSGNDESAIAELQRSVQVLQKEQETFSRETAQLLQQLQDAIGQNDVDAFDISQYIMEGRRVYFERVGDALTINTTGGFDWEKVLFGYSIATNVLSVKAGEIHFKDKIYTCAADDVTISADNTYVYAQMEWGTGICSIGQDTVLANATTSTAYFRKWLYLVTYVSTPNTISIKTFGHTGGAISIMPVFG